MGEFFLDFIIFGCQKLTSMRSNVDAAAATPLIKTFVIVACAPSTTNSSAYDSSDTT
jgi:hypothetical protein